MTNEEETVYVNTIDQGVWQLLVVRDPENPAYSGILTVTAKQKIYGLEDGDVILTKQVPLSYGAVFGPDAADVYEWQEAAVEAVDAEFDKRYYCEDF